MKLLILFAFLLYSFNCSPIIEDVGLFNDDLSDSILRELKVTIRRRGHGITQTITNGATSTATSMISQVSFLSEG